MKIPKIKVALKKKSAKKVEIEVPEILSSTIKIIFKNKFHNQEDELELFDIPIWLYHLLAILCFLYKLFNSIKIIIIIIVFLIGTILFLC